MAQLSSVIGSILRDIVSAQRSKSLFVVAWRLLRKRRKGERFSIA